ncbi:MAG: 16S rRNA (cytidine(1402)-2'-O)-methyltransferase [Syntrophomonadaceae bacterium]|nr:16S rRNA (cytidine(1402)-2'-O)-methyltransferase [Syntrophomonadaceae bacterium]
MPEEQGVLYICATPIGNLEDVTIRLLKTLRQADLIACEDTRHTLKLLNRYKIKRPLTSYHQHSKLEKVDYIIGQLQEGKKVALVSDAGMPGISDPGSVLVARAIACGIKLEVIPGPSAVISALALSGMDTTSFTFVGFLPSRRSERQKSIRAIAQEPRTIVLYEAPHRLLDTLNDLAEILGEERPIAVMREMTKLHESVARDTVGRLIQHYQQDKPRGEITLVIAPYLPPSPSEVSLEQVMQEVDELIQQGLEKKEAFKLKAREYKIAKSTIYKRYFDKIRQ